MIKVAFRKWSVSQEDTDTSGHQVGNTKVYIDYEFIFVKKRKTNTSVYIYTYTFTFIY